jgi:hypothetical protein
MKWAALLILLAGPALGAPLDDAIALVLRVSPALAEQRTEVRAIERQSDWISKVSLGYRQRQTQTEAGGYNAGVTVEIPLFSRKREIAAAKARRALAAARQQLLSHFLDEVAKLVELEGRRAEAAEMASFYRDRLEYFKRAVDEGRLESDTLWVDAEKAKKAEHDAAQGERKLAAALEESARRYGEQEWKTLRALLAAHVKQSRP